MLLTSTFLVSAVWWAIVWFYDPDGLRQPAGKRAPALQHVADSEKLVLIERVGKRGLVIAAIIANDGARV